MVEGGPSVFWSIGVYSCPFVVRLHEPSAVFPRVIRPVRGQAPGSQANGSFPKGTGRLSEKSPAGYPPPLHRDDTPGSAGVPPACCPFGCRSVSLRCCSRPPCRRDQHRPGRRKAVAPFPVDPSGGDGRGCARLGAGGTPALPGGLPPMTGSHQRDKSAEAFWRQLSLKEVHLSSGLFMFIRVHSWFVFMNHRLFFLE